MISLIITIPFAGGDFKMKKRELLKHQLINNGFKIVEKSLEKGQVILGKEKDGFIVMESYPEDILTVKKYLNFYGYKYMLRIRNSKTQILLKL